MPTTTGVFRSRALRRVLQWIPSKTPAGPTATRGQISFAELEVPLVPTRGQISWAELEIPLVPTRGLISWAEMEVPIAPTRGQTSWAELEVPAAPTRGQISWAEFQVPDVSSGTTRRLLRMGPIMRTGGG